MDTRTADREVIEKVLADYAAIPYAHGDVLFGRPLPLLRGPRGLIGLGSGSSVDRCGV